MWHKNHLWQRSPIPILATDKKTHPSISKGWRHLGKLRNTTGEGGDFKIPAHRKKDQRCQWEEICALIWIGNPAGGQQKWANSYQKILQNLKKHDDWAISFLGILQVLRGTEQILAVHLSTESLSIYERFTYRFKQKDNLTQWLIYQETLTCFWRLTHQIWTNKPVTFGWSHAQ